MYNYSNSEKPKVQAKKRFKHLQTTIESSFTEFMNDKKQNTIPGCIYKYSKTIVSEFTNDFMLTLKEKLSLEKKR